MQDKTLTETLSLTDEETSLPEGWRLVELGQLCSQINYGFTASADFTKDEPKFLRITDIQDGKVNWSKVPSCKISESEEKSNLPHDGDIVFARTGGTTGKSFLIENPPRAVFASYLIRLQPNEEVDSKFLYLYFQSYDYWRQIRAGEQGGIQPNVNATILSKLQIPLPPTIEEQRRIASVLDEQMKAVEQARLAVEEQLKAANLLPNAFLRVVFESEETQNWQKRKLGELLNLRKDIVHPRNNPKGEALFVGLEHIESSTGRRTGVIEVRKEQLTGRKPQFYRNDLVYGYLRPYLNKLWKAEFDGLCSVDQYVYSVNTNEADTDYLAYFMRSHVYLAKAPIDTTPGQLPRIRTEEVASVEINLPDIENQKHTVEKLNEQMQAAETLKKSLTEKLEAVKKLPAALLRKAFAGEL